MVVASEVGENGLAFDLIEQLGLKSSAANAMRGILLSFGVFDKDSEY